MNVAKHSAVSSHNACLGQDREIGWKYLNPNYIHIVLKTKLDFASTADWKLGSRDRSYGNNWFHSAVCVSISGC